MSVSWFTYLLGVSGKCRHQMLRLANITVVNKPTSATARKNVLKINKCFSTITCKVLLNWPNRKSGPYCIARCSILNKHTTRRRAFLVLLYTPQWMVLSCLNFFLNNYWPTYLFCYLWNWFTLPTTWKPSQLQEMLVARVLISDVQGCQMTHVL